MARKKSRQPKAKSRKKATPAAAAAPVEVVEEAKGAGVETAIAVMTFLALLTACLFIDHMLGNSYGGGLFFKP